MDRSLKNIKAFLKAAVALRGIDDALEHLTNAERTALVKHLIGTKAPVALKAGYYVIPSTDGIVDFDKVPVEYRDSWTPTGLMPIANQKISTIKLVRNVTGLGLKEAKDFVEGCRGYLTEDNVASLKAFFGDSMER